MIKPVVIQQSGVKFWKRTVVGPHQGVPTNQLRLYCSTFVPGAAFLTYVLSRHRLMQTTDFLLLHHAKLFIRISKLHHMQPNPGKPTTYPFHIVLQTGFRLCTPSCLINLIYDFFRVQYNTCKCN